MQYYSQADIIKETGYSRQHLLSFRIGGKVSVVTPTAEGKKKKYMYATQPILQENEDWQYKLGKVVYTMSGREKILRHKEEKQSKVPTSISQ